MNFWHSFLSLCNANRTSPNRVAKELSIGSATVTGWKNGAMPSDKNMMKIADYFQVDWELLKAGSINGIDSGSVIPIGKDEVPGPNPGSSSSKKTLETIEFQGFSFTFIAVPNVRQCSLWFAMIRFGTVLVCQMCVRFFPVSSLLHRLRFA